MNPQTKRDVLKLKVPRQPHGYTFIYPQTKREQATSSASRVYFYTPATKQGTSHATTPYNHMGILLYTHKHRGLHKTSELSPHPRGYTFIYPQTLEDNSSRPNTFTPSRVYFYAPANKRITKHLGTFSKSSRVYFYIPTTIARTIR